MSKKKVKIFIGKDKTVLLPSCPNTFSLFLSMISKYLDQRTKQYSLIFKDNEGDICEILDEATFEAFSEEFETKLILHVVPVGDCEELNCFSTPSQRPRLNYFRRRSRLCFTYYIDTKEVLKSQLDVGINLKEYAAWVNLPTGEVFYCGGGYPISSNEVYIINTGNNSYKKLANMIYSRHSHGILYNNGFIYVFGGLENQLAHASIMSKCEKYNISQNTWEEIPEIDSPRGDVSASVYNEKIYILGKGSKSISDYFFHSKILDLGEDSGGCSLIHDQYFYTFHGSCLKIWDLNKMSIIEKVVLPGCKSWWSHSPPIWYQDSIYFVWWEEPGWICKFNTVNKEFSKLQSFC